MWENLPADHFLELDKPKAAFMKRALSVHRNTRNRVVYWMTGEPLMTEDIRRTFDLRRTAAFDENCENWLSKMCDIRHCLAGYGEL